MKRTWTTKELFDVINNDLKEKNLLPNILDYSLGPFEDFAILSNEFSLLPKIDFGCEGIYLDLFLVGDIGYGDGRKRYDLGTYKTLYSDKNAYRDMAILQTDFVFAYMEIMHNYSDDFIHQGYKVDFMADDGSTWYGIYIMDDTTGYEETLMNHVKGFSNSSRDHIHTCNVYSNDTGELINIIEFKKLLEPLT